MLKITALLKKAFALALILAIGLAAFPVTTVYATGLADQDTPPTDHPAGVARLEKIWAREKAMYERQDERLAKAEEFFAKVQSRIDKATAKGYDTAGVQAALDSLKEAVNTARPIHENAASIIASHAGFNAAGKVTDRAQARETVKLLGQSLKDFRSAVGGPFKALREAVKAFREAH